MPNFQSPFGSRLLPNARSFPINLVSQENKRDSEQGSLQSGSLGACTDRRDGISRDNSGRSSGVITLIPLKGRITSDDRSRAILNAEPRRKAAQAKRQWHRTGGIFPLIWPAKLVLRIIRSARPLNGDPVPTDGSGPRRFRRVGHPAGDGAVGSLRPQR
jgi:hypothetical protein